MPADVALEICSNGREGDAAGRISLCPGRGMEMYGVRRLIAWGRAAGNQMVRHLKTRHYRESRRV